MSIIRPAKPINFSVPGFGFRLRRNENFEITRETFLYQRVRALGLNVLPQ